MSSASEATFQFDADTAVRPAVDRAASWTAEVSSDYNIGENPNGGYLMAIVLQALRAELEGVEPPLGQPDPLTLTAHFLRPGIPDADARIVTEVRKLGRSITTARATLEQGDKVRVEMMAGFGDLSSATSQFDDITVAPPDLPPPDRCVDRAELVQGVDLPLLNRVGC